MPHIVFSQQAQTDLKRLYLYLVEKDVELAQRALFEIDKAISNQLTNNPKICRQVGYGLREFIIRFGQSGYIALFDYNEENKTVEILAVRHQLENDYKE